MTSLAEWLRLVVVTPGRGDPSEILDLAGDAISGGATAIWIRERSLDRAALLDLCVRVRDRIVPMDGRVLVSGDAGVVAEARLDAVHLGFRDVTPTAARSGQCSFRIGYSAHDPLDDAAIAAADYVTLSPVFETPSKTGLVDSLGISRFAELRRRIAVPVLGLGGVDATTAGEVVRAGADGVVVMRAVTEASNREHAARELRSKVDEALP